MTVQGICKEICSSRFSVVVDLLHTKRNQLEVICDGDLRLKPTTGTSNQTTV